MTDRRTLGARLGIPIRRIRPEFDMDVWRAKRHLRIRSEVRDLADLDARLNTASQDIHLVVVPHYGPDAPTWHVAGQNHFFEVWRSAQEILGSLLVTLVVVD